MTRSMTTRMSTRLNTYTAYSMSCAAVWSFILAAAQRRLELGPRKMLRLACAGWWSGWLSATIARAGYPPPKQLSPAAEKRLGLVSAALIAVGLISVGRLLVKGNRPSTGTP